MDHFTPIASLAGGALIGLSASILLAFNGRPAGISGIFAGVLAPARGELTWRAAFMAGLVLGGFALYLIAPACFAVTYDRSILTVAIGGLLVGVGVRLAGGCTSGHGVCGLSRLSGRSLVATITFIATGALTVFLMRTLGGAL